MPTLGADINIKEITINNQTLKFRIWDLAGQPKFDVVRKQYFRGSVGAILMYDISESDSLPNLHNWVNQLDENNLIKKIPIVVVGNKIDLRKESESNLITKKEGLEFVERLEGELGEERPKFFFESSAKDNINTSKIFKKLGEEVVKFIGS